jgi:hypothetical protein
MPLLNQAVANEHARVRIWLPAALLLVHLEDPDMAADLTQRWVAHVSDNELSAPYLDRLTGQLTVTSPATARSLLTRMLASTHLEARRRAGHLATYFDISDVDLNTTDGRSPLALAMDNEAGRRGIAEQLVRLIDKLPARADTDAAIGTRADHALLVHLGNDESDDIRVVVMDVGRHMTRPLGEYDGLLNALADTEAFGQHPGNLLRMLSQRLDDLPSAALKLCQVWSDRYASTANDMANRETSEAPAVTDIVLALYSQAEPGSVRRKQCLNLIDLFIEQRIGDIERKADEVDYAPGQ